MMGAAQTPDPHVWPVVLRLRAERKDLIVGALSNTITFPTGHVFAKGPNMSVSTDIRTMGDDRGAGERAGQQTTEGFTEEGHSWRDLASYFDVFIASSQVSLRKPEPRIYELAIRQLDAFDRRRGGDGVVAPEVVFLDDIGANLKPAREIGMQTVLVRIGDTATAVRELEEIIGGWGLEGKGEGEGERKMGGKWAEAKL